MKPTIRTAEWDRIVTSVPLNTDAAKARDGRGVSFEPTLRPDATRTHSELPLPTRPVDKARNFDLTGATFGRGMRVIGLALKPKQGETKAAWVVRCACGNYEHRTAKAIRNPANTGDCCRPCRHVENLKRQDREGTRGKSRIKWQSVMK